MADVKFSGIGVVDLNGSIGDTVFSRNFYGTYAKSKPPTPPNTPNRLSWQGIVDMMVNIWTSVFTDTDRERWYQVARLKQDDLAATNSITGFQLFMSVNLNNFLVGGGVISSPDLSNSPAIGSNFIATSPSANQLSISGTLPSLNFAAVYVAPNLSPGRMSNNQVYRYLTFVGGLFLLNLTADFTLKFGSAPGTGTKCFVKLVPIALTSGKTGIPLYSSVIIN